MTDYVKLPELARRLDVSQPTARRLVKSGKLPSIFVGGAYRVSKEDLKRYLENARVVPEGDSGKGTAPQSWRDRLRELPNGKQNALLRASQDSEEWVDGLVLNDLQELQEFCISNNVTSGEVFEELKAQIPELPEIAQRQRGRVLRETDNAVRRRRGEDAERHA